MDSSTPSNTSAAHDVTQAWSLSSNPLEMMLVARLQTRLAVVETELRHAEKERQETLLGTQVLLRLLGSNTASPGTIHNTEANVPFAQSSSALHKQFQLVVKECERLRKKCRRLRVRNKIERTMEIMKFKQRLLALGAVGTESSNTNETTGTGNTLTTPNDDIMQEESSFHYDEPNDSVLDEDDFGHEFQRGEMLDDADTSAPWYIAARKDVEAKIAPTQHGHDSEPSMHLKLDQACLIDPVSPVNDHFKTLKDAQSDMQLCQSSVAYQAVPSTSARSKIFRLLPTDPSEDFRMVSISNLSDDVEAGDVLSVVAGGAVVCLSISRSASMAKSCTAYVTFYHHIAAANFVAHYKDCELVINGRAVEVTHIQSPAVPEVLERMRSEFCTRCLTITGCYPTLTILDVKEDLCRFDSRNEENIVDMDFDGGDVMCISFISVSAAVHAFDYMTSSGRYAEYHVQWSHDPCARRLVAPQRRDSALIIPAAPQHRSLTSGAYLRRMEVIGRTQTAPRHRLPPGARDYTDLDSIKTRNIVDLMYDEKPEDTFVDRDEFTEPTASLDHEAHPVIPLASKSIVMNDHEIEAQESLSTNSTTEESASLKDFELENNDNVSGTSKLNTTARAPASDVSASSPSAQPVHPGLLEFAKAMASISEPSPSSSSVLNSDSSDESVSEPKSAPLGLAASKWASNNHIPRSAGPSPEPEPVMRLPSPPSFGFDLEKLMRPAVAKKQAVQTMRAGGNTVKIEAENHDESDDAASKSEADSDSGVYSTLPRASHDRDAVSGRSGIQPRGGQAKEILADHNRGRKLVSYDDL